MLNDKRPVIKVINKMLIIIQSNEYADIVHILDYKFVPYKRNKLNCYGQALNHLSLLNILNVNILNFCRLKFLFIVLLHFVMHCLHMYVYSLCMFNKKERGQYCIVLFVKISNCCITVNTGEPNLVVPLMCNIRRNYHLKILSTFILYIYLDVSIFMSK